MKTIIDKINNILGEETTHEKIWGKDKLAGYKELGYINGWDKTPAIVEKCEKKNHQLKARSVDRSVIEYYCDICKYKYSVDSSD